MKKEKNMIWVIIIIIILIVFGVVLLKNDPKAEISEEIISEDGIVIDDEPSVLEEFTTVVPDTSPVSKDNKVLNSEGGLANNAALPGSPEAPKLSRYLDEEELSTEVIKLTITAAGFTPNKFTVEAGQVVALVVTSGDEVHVFKFDDSSLQAIAIGVDNNEIKAIVFNAPQAGDYTFYCDVPDHRSRGETGVMHVK